MNLQFQASKDFLTWLEVVSRLKGSFSTMDLEYIVDLCFNLGQMCVCVYIHIHSSYKLYNMAGTMESIGPQMFVNTDIKINKK